MPGPPPNPNRRRRNATVAMTKLPAEGRKGDTPEWPLPPDVTRQAKLDRLNEQIDDASLEAQGDDRAAKNAQRRLLSLRERAEILAAEIEAAAEQETVLWRELWVDVQERYELERHEERLLVEMCRTADTLDELAGVVAAEGVMVEGRTHPALVESRQLRIAFARLSAALRLPAGDEGDQQSGARRPQRRVGVRQPYRLRGVAG